MAFKTTSLTLDSKYDDLKLSALIVAPTEPRATVSFVHGMCEHKERYLPILEYLAERGYACIIHDHRGHGASVKSEKDLGHFYSGGFHAQIEDIRLAADHIAELYPNVPHFMFGHSMGSLAVRAFIKRYDDRIDGLFVCGCPSYNPAVPFAKVLINGMIKLLGERYRSDFVKQLVFGSYNSKFDGVVSKNDWLCSNPQTVAAYDNDPLCGFSFTLNGYKNLMGLLSDMYSDKGWVRKNPDLPIHFISGEDDPCMINRKRFLQAVELLQNIGYKQVSYRLFPKMRHEILNETDRTIVYDEITERLEAWQNQ